VFVLKEDKIFYQYLGGYSDYLNNVKEEEKKEEKKSFSPRESKKEIPKLTYNEQKELDTIEDHITELEYQMKDIDELIQVSGNDYSKTKELYIQRELVEKTLNDKLERWAYLTDIKEKSKRKS